MRYEIAVLLGSDNAFYKTHYIAARNGGGLKHQKVGYFTAVDYIAAGNGGGLKRKFSYSNYIAAGNSGGLKRPDS